MYDATKDVDLRTKQGWDRMKLTAKGRSVLFTHYAPPCEALRLHRINEATYGSDHRWTRAAVRSEAYVEELRITTRCLSLAAIKHAIGDFFSVELSWPNPVQELPQYRELADQPGVYRVTTDEPVDGEGLAVTRRLLSTNVPWLWQLTRDSPMTHRQPTLSGNWKV